MSDFFTAIWALVSGWASGPFGLFVIAFVVTLAAIIIGSILKGS